MATMPPLPPIQSQSEVKITQTSTAEGEKTEIEVRDKVKPAWYWISGSDGYGSITATLVFVSFWVTTLAYVLAIFEKVGPLSIRPFDSGACAAFFSPILILYFGRKFTDARYGAPAKGSGS